MSTPGIPSIEVCPSSDWTAAFELAFSHLGETARRQHVHNALLLLSAGDIEADGVFVARARNRIVGVLIAVPLKGAGGLVWPPRCRCADRDTESNLVREALA